MKKYLSRLIGSLTAVCVLVTSMTHMRTEVPAEVYTEHIIEAGDSYEGNPLKGFVPYNYGKMEFPHSMEWFYIAVNEVQTGMNEFDWTALEEKLDDVASRGHQAVMRFYYDYPDVETGVPQFLIDGGLEMKYYNEPVDLGGAGYAPDYENETFRQSMQNFIKAFGAEYDGDGRLAYVTLGLLGFWGEWHNWQYDDDTSDGREDWSISTEVYKEVLDAYDEAFDMTQLCVREPKYGIDYSNYDIGFHDDSFGYATLSSGKGGQSWSFMEKMFDFDLGNKWEKNCIGGEIYPPSQYLIFNGSDSNDGSYQNWGACMEEAHATWMLCDAMRYYEGDMLEKAREAAVGMGYDFQVSKAYFADNVTTDSLHLQVDIKNIGCAPFYYDHNTWPVEIGVKQGDTVVKTWRTEWDLCDIPANSTDVTFDYSIDNHGLSVGSYTIGIKVINPVEGGNILGFANATQGSDGWLTLGTIDVVSNVSENESSSEVTTEEKTSEEESEVITETETEPMTEVMTEVIISDDLEIAGYQISTTADGFRTLYSYEETVEGQEVTEVGLVYGINFDGYSADDMVVNSANEYVHSFAGTEEHGRISETWSMYKSYAMTMKFAVCTAQEFTVTYYVRAYAKLADGSYVYSKIANYSVFDIAKSLYDKALMSTSEAHDYLYTKILSVVDKEYPVVEHGWSPIVKPSK